ncbi:MAG: helix-turn-helix transcriptional regulator [Cyanobacteria bacterium SZAS-4]|nr:helix-turn-helix transcriptional regulator [Cyanobacteria bacterium SZAS-4]
MPNFVECFGKIIYARRRKLRLSQEELSINSGIDRSFISSLEKGKRNPSLLTILKIADGLKTSSSKLMKEAEECTKGM